MTNAVLIVDDDASLAQTLVSVLAGLQVPAEHTLMADTAIELIRAKRYPVVVIDLRLGESPSGIYVVDAIRKMPQEDRPLVLMMTAAGMEHLRGVDRQVVIAVLLKPLDLELFAHYVRATYERALKDRPTPAPVMEIARRSPRTFCGQCNSEIPPWMADAATLPAIVDSDDTFQVWLDTECRTCGTAPRRAGGRTELA